ncbi:unnamed protein product [Sphenostylis stenocarpa]|uniref:Uncharacterized protein n=1 Tax=Sphenostylis stenocarpa TaxID=92480 RepID=A0AA86VQX7_9FABA|nr:unnamed protein product [Sphenostylis stenocarpa]
MNGCNSDFDGNGLSMEVSAIYLAMKNSKLECVDEHGQDPVSSDIWTEEDDCSSLIASIDPAVLASLPPSMQLDLLVQVV